MANLIESIRDHGQVEPILLFEGEVLDGWGRYRACLETNNPPWIENYSGDAKSAARFVVDHNAHRRNLTKTERAIAILRLRRMTGGVWLSQGNRGKDKEKSGINLNKEAKKAGVSPATMNMAANRLKAEEIEAAANGGKTPPLYAAQKKVVERILRENPANIPDRAKKAKKKFRPHLYGSDVNKKRIRKLEGEVEQYKEQVAELVEDRRFLLQLLVI